MSNTKQKELTKSISVQHFIFILLFGFIIFDFILSASFRSPLLRFLLSKYLLSSLLLFSIPCVLLFICMALYRSQKEPNPTRYFIILFPITLLSFWPVQESHLPIFIPFLIVISTQIVFYKILFSKEDSPIVNKPGKERIALLIIIILYFFIFSYLSIGKFNALDFFNPKDLGLFNQIFWNTIHGKFFLNSTYGSHFACHNSPFFLFLLPFYYLFPYPLTLLILKVLLLALSAIPFYLITKDILKQTTSLPLVVAFMLFPFIVGQNFTPPHESGYAPLFILFTYYFFRTNKFIPFMCFLLITVSIKEPYALVAVMFGCYAFFKKRGAVWIVYPILIGIMWFFFSIALINYFQNLYHPHSDSAWFFVYLKKVFLMQNKNGPLTPIVYLFSNSNMVHWYALKSMFLLFLPLAIIPPLLSSISLLGLPELIVNLISGNPNMFSPIWHYDIMLSCFVLIGTVEGIKKISSFAYNKRYIKINEQKLQLLLCVFVLSCTLIRSYTWIGLGKYKKDVAYIQRVKEALSFVPPNSSIGVPARVAIIVSSREKYSIIGDESGEDYVLVDSPEIEKYLKTNIDSDYNAIFHKKPITLYKRKK